MTACPELGTLETVPLPVEARAHVETCAACRLVVELIGVGHQPDLLEELVDGLEVPGHTDQLGQVLQPSLGFDAALGLQLGEHLLFIGAIAVVDTVVPGQIARGLAGRDDIVGGHGVLAVRQGDLSDHGPKRLVHANRLAHGPVDLRIEPFAEMLPHQPDP